VSEKLLEMRHFRVLLCPEGPDWAPSWAAGVVRDRENERNASNGRGWMYNRRQARTAKWKCVLKGRCCLQIRRDLVFVSSVLFTIALVSVIPPAVEEVRAMYPPASMELSGVVMGLARLGGERGILSLTIILIGLIVIWAGYVKRTRWTWFVMFTIVFGWAFTELMLPWLEVTPWELVLAAIKGAGPARGIVEGRLVFSLMVIALFLPARAFFSRGRR